MLQLNISSKTPNILSLYKNHFLEHKQRRTVGNQLKHTFFRDTLYVYFFYLIITWQAP